MSKIRVLFPLMCSIGLLSCAQTPTQANLDAQHGASTVPTEKAIASAPATSPATQPAIQARPFLTEAEFSVCVKNFTAQAQAEGISNNTINASLGKATLNKRVLELDRQQPEFTTTFADYFNRRVTNQRITQGRALWDSNRALLDRIEQQYGVPAPYLLAFWGLETNFGNYFGNNKVVDSLATLACDTRRSSFFTIELINALRILDKGDIAPEKMLGSWAGAMGNFQFMPSSYLKNAVDYDGDNKRDLWNSKPDAMASAAYFLKSLGWKNSERWGREVKLPSNFPFLEAGLNNTKSLSEWRKMGITNADNSPLAQADINASLLIPAGHQGPAFLVYENFNVIMRWNRSEFYAIAVGQLADQIAGGKALVQPPPTDAPRLHRQQVMQLQATLNQKGFDAGKPDGIFGPGTRRAMSEFQANQGMIADGFPDKKTLSLLGITAQ